MLAFASSIAAQPCEPRWSDDFPDGGLEADVFALRVFDPDGPGPEAAGLYAGYRGETAGGLSANGIARWDGRNWTRLDKGVGGTNAAVLALEVFDEDAEGPALPALFAGGTFTTAGGQPCGYIARWDGQAWTPVGGGVDASIAALRTVDEDGPGPAAPVLMAGGAFTHAGGVEAHFIARWNGSAWSALGTGLDKAVRAFEVFDDDGDGPRIPALYAGGDFQYAGGKQVNRLARWNGQAWEKWESGINSAVTSLAVMDDDGDGPLPAALYVGGFFWKIGGHAFGGIGRWDGHAWDDLHGGVAGSVSALGAFDPDGEGPQTPSLYVAGSFSTAGGIQARQSARWDGQQWSEPDGEVVSRIYAFAAFDPDGDGPSPTLLHGAGDLSRAGSALPSGIAAMVDGKWTSLGAGFDGWGVADLITMDRDGDGPEQPTLYASGLFATVDGAAALRIARWDGHSWIGLNGGIDWTDRVAIGSFDPDEDGPLPPDLYAGGSFMEMNQQRSVLARWTGEAWEKVSDLGDSAEDLLQFDEDGAGPLPPALFICGWFPGGVKRWDGQSLSDVGGGVGDGYDVVYALTPFDADGNGPMHPLLVAAGYFTQAEGKPASYVAAWDGATWFSVGKGLLSWARDVNAVDADGPGPRVPVLYAAGDFATGVAEWSGSKWLYKGPGGPGYGLLGFDPDGPGPAPVDLYVGTSPQGLSRSNGTKWATVAGGLNGPAYALAVLEDPAVPQNPSLFAGGTFTSAGSRSSGRIARLLCPLKTCTADCNRDGSLDFFDFMCFLGLFNAGDPAADCDSSGVLDVFDFLCFVNLVNDGCP